MSKEATATAVDTWSPRDKSVSVYVDELTKETVKALKGSIPLRSEAEVARLAFEAGLPTLPGYEKAKRTAERVISERERAATRAATAARA